MEAPVAVVVGDVAVPQPGRPAVALVVIRRDTDAQKIHLVIARELLHGIERALDQQGDTALPRAAAELRLAVLRRERIWDRCERRPHVGHGIPLPINSFRRQEAAPGHLHASRHGDRGLEGRSCGLGVAAAAGGRRLNCLNRRLALRPFSFRSPASAGFAVGVARHRFDAAIVRTGHRQPSHRPVAASHRRMRPASIHEVCS